MKDSERSTKGSPPSPSKSRFRLAALFRTRWISCASQRIFKQAHQSTHTNFKDALDQLRAAVEGQGKAVNGSERQ